MRSGFPTRKGQALAISLQREKMGILGQLLGKIFFLVGVFSDRRVYLDTAGCVRSFVLLFRIFFLELEKVFFMEMDFFWDFFIFVKLFFVFCEKNKFLRFFFVFL